MTTTDSAAFLLVMAAGIFALTAVIFAGSLLVTYLRRAEPVEETPAGGGNKSCDRPRTSNEDRKFTYQ